MKDWIDLSIDLAQLRDRPMPTKTRILELEVAVERLRSAQTEVRLSDNPTAEELARHHLALAQGHVQKLVKLHPDLPTPKKKAKKSPALKPPVHVSQQVVQNDREGLAGRLAYSGSSELRFRGVGDLRPGEEQRGVRRPLEVRNLAGGKGSLVNIEGEPIRYDHIGDWSTSYQVQDAFGTFTERMLPGVATHLLANADCRFLFGHSGLPLSRTKAGTMHLRDTYDALRFTAVVDIRQRLANDLVIAIERGDVSQMSVGFVVDEGGDEWSTDCTRRSVSRFRSLEDVSAVTYPASPTTSISLAGMGGRVA